MRAPRADWVPWLDDDSEGVSSCFGLFSIPSAVFAAASSGCPPYSHLMSIRSANRTAGLFLLLTKVYDSFFWLGCNQRPYGSLVGRTWEWVDGTDDTNLNCGDGINSLGQGPTSCNLWRQGEPCVPLYSLATAVASFHICLFAVEY